MRKRYKISNWGQIVRREPGDETGREVPAYIPMFAKLFIIVGFAWTIKSFIFSDKVAYSDKVFLESELDHVIQITNSLGVWTKHKSHLNPPFFLKVSADFKLHEHDVSEQSIITTVMKNLDWKPCSDNDKTKEIKLCKKSYVSKVDQNFIKATLLLTKNVHYKDKK